MNDYKDFGIDVDELDRLLAEYGGGDKPKAEEPAAEPEPEKPTYEPEPEIEEPAPEP